MTRVRRHKPRFAPGLSLVELLLALASTGLIAAAVAAMLVSVSYGTSSRQDLRALVVKSKTLTGRIDAALRNTHMVLEAGDNYLVLWLGDTRVDEQPNLSEIQLLELDADAGAFRSYKAVMPTGLSEDALAAADTAYTLETDFAAVTQALKGGSGFPASTWATGVQQWQVTLNDVEQEATLVSYRLTLTTEHEHMNNEVISTAALRNQ